MFFRLMPNSGELLGAMLGAIFSLDDYPKRLHQFTFPLMVLIFNNYDIK